MIVLGIDPGIERLGWAVVKKTSREITRIDSGVKKTSKGDYEPARLAELYDFLQRLIRTHRPSVISVENIFFSKNTKTALRIAGVRAVISLAAHRHGVPIKEFAPAELKLAIAGYGRADKKQIASLLKAQLILPPRRFGDDEIDALALALCGVYYK